MATNRTAQTGNEAAGYGKCLRVGLHFTQPNLPGSLSKCDSYLTPGAHGPVAAASLVSST